MELICFHQASCYNLGYTDEFVGIIDIQDTEHGLRGDVILESTKSDARLIVGTCISRDATPEEILEYSKNLLNNKDFCMSIFENVAEI